MFPFFTNVTVFWLVLMVILLGIEALAPGLVCIWFAFGALAALAACLLHAPGWLQLLVFLIVSAALLFLTRPFAKKYINAKVQPTNADRILSAECIVKEDIDNIAGSGTIAVAGKDWSARSEDGSVISAGEHVIVQRIEGVKAIVKKV